MSRRPDALRGRVARTTEVVAGDVLDANSLATALDGVEVASYFVHRDWVRQPVIRTHSGTRRTPVCNDLSEG